MISHTDKQPEVVEKTFDSQEQLADSLTVMIAERLCHALDSRPRASLVVSGGNTPVAFFRRLRELALPWNRIDVTLADERWVDPGHPDSNERLVRQELLQEAASSATLLPLKTPADSPESAITECTARLATLSRPFDAVILGMGNDGHTASLFPHTAALQTGLLVDGEASCVASRPENATHPRLSLSLSALLDTRCLILHIHGQDKWRVLERARSGTDTQAMPIRAVLQQNRVPVHIYRTA